jgi:hypothetical protein
MPHTTEPDPQPVHFFIHIPKCGGNTFSDFLAKQFPVEKIYTAAKSTAAWEEHRKELAARAEQLSGEDKGAMLRERFAAEMRSHDLVIENHYTWVIADLLRQHRQLKTYVILREPRERVASHYLHLRRIPVEEAHALAPEGRKLYSLAKDLSITDFCRCDRYDVWSVVFNQQARTLNSQTISQVLYQQCDQRAFLENSLANLSQADFVADLADLDEFAQLVSLANGWLPPGRMGVLNPGKHTASEASDLAATVPDEIVELDMQIYEAACRQYQRWKAEVFSGAAVALWKHQAPWATPANDCWTIDFRGPLQGTNFHGREGAGPDTFRWMGPERDSRLFVPVRPGESHQIAIFIAAFIDPDLLSGTVFRINNADTSPVLSVEDNCTVATFEVAAEATSSGLVELLISPPFTASDRDKGFGTDARQKSMALRRIRISRRSSAAAALRIEPASPQPLPATEAASSPEAPSLPRRTFQGSWSGHAVGRRLIFLHVPKTAGTSITTYLRQQFAERDAMPQLQANFHRSHPIWPLVARRHQLLGVGMHLDHDRVAAMQRGLSHEPAPFLFTVLREPRDRLFSRYKEWRATPDEHMQAAEDRVKEAILTARGQSFSEFLRSENPVVKSTLDNVQARLLAGLNISRKLSDEELLERARHNLASYDLVGTTALCDETIAVLADAFGWPQPVEGTPRVHVSARPPAEAIETTDEDEERIAAFTQLDKALWDDLLGDRLTLVTTTEESPGMHEARELFCHGGDSPALCETKLYALPASGDRVPKASSPAATQPAESLGRGHTTVVDIIQRTAADRVVGLGRRKWFPGPEDDPRPLALEERVLVVVRMPALSHQRSYIIRRGSIPPQSLLAITEVDPEDPRLAAFLHCPHVLPYAGLEGEGDDAVLAVAIGRMRSDRGEGFVDAFIETLERCSSTHPSALRSLQDSPAARMLAMLELEIFLAAVASWLEGEPVASSHAAILASLHPEDRDPLLTSAASQRPSLASHWKRATVAVSASRSQRDAVLKEHLAALENALQPLLILSEVAENAPLDQIRAAVDAAFALLCGLSVDCSAG